MANFDYDTTTSNKVLKYLKDRGFKLSEADKSVIRIAINEATSTAWEEGIRNDNGCNCGQVSCPICTP
jgi:hypothetical protein